MIWSRLCGYSIHCDIVNPKLFELEACQGDLSRDIRHPDLGGGGGLIQQRIVDFRLMGAEFRLYAASRAYLS